MSVYKGDKVVAGGSVDTYFVRKPAWSQAVAVTAAQLLAGYTAPNDGIFIGYGIANASAVITVNDVAAATSQHTTGYNSYFNVQVQVNRNDVIKVSATFFSEPVMSFVPFEDSTIAEPEVVTPEYIRNQNILSGVEDIGTIGNSEANAYVCPYDGIIWLANSVNSSNAFSIYINGEIVSYQAGTVPSGAILTTPNITVKKGDKVWIGSNLGTHYFNKARYYKLRDYRGR